MAEAKDLGGAVVGATVPFLDAPEKAAGEPLYLDDLRLPGMLVARALRSEHAHARILSVNAADARRVPGAAAVLTGADLPGRPAFSPTSGPRRSSRAIEPVTWAMWWPSLRPRRARPRRKPSGASG